MRRMPEFDEILNGLVLELRRGSIVLSVLSQLERPEYGYSLVQLLEEKGMPVDAGTLYPLLRRLEKQGLLRSEWKTTGSKPRKYYLLTDDGERAYQTLSAIWRKIARNMEGLLIGGKKIGRE